MSDAIAKEYAEWAARCIPPDAGPTQREEMKRAFYSGFVACFIHQLNEIATIADDAEAEARLGALQKEGEEYFHTLRNAPPRTPPPRTFNPRQ